MMLRPTRRQVLAGAGALTLAPGLARAGLPEALEAAPAVARLTPEGGPETAVWAYGGTVPGPEIRVAQGARVTRRFVNALPQPSTVHWHGLRLPNAMDGVTNLTQPAVEPGAEFLYDFVAPDAGTFWYHPHNRTYEQLARGLYGPLIVEEARTPDVDADLVLMLDDWRLDPDGALAGGFGSMHDRAHGGRIGNWITVNGKAEWTRPAARGARLRLRLINAANARIFTVGAQGLEGWVVALDGMPLETPEPLERVVLGPAQRADLIVDVTGEDEGVLYSLERDGGYVVAAFPATGPAQARRAGPPAALPPNAQPVMADPGSARTIALPMEGGAMGQMRRARMQGRQQGVEALARAGMAWSLAGTAGMPAQPLAELARGETVRIAMTNDTAWPHAMHLHGHHFRELKADGALGPWRDTILLDRGEAKEIALVADNPGDWLLHCHMLEHAAAGMMTWLRVA